MSRFISLREPKEFWDAVQVLNKLPPGEMDKVFAHCVAHHLENRFGEVFKLKATGGRICIQRLLGKKCNAFNWRNPMDGGRCECVPPGTDHASMWVQGRSPVLFVSQPYGLTARTLQEMHDFAKKYGLEFDVSAEASWWFPSRTVLVCWRVKESRVVSDADKRDIL